MSANSTAAAAGPSSAAQFDPAAQEQTVTTLLLVLILGPLPPILLVACCALARHCLRKLRRKWAKRRARGGSRSPLGRRARRNSGSLTPLTNRSTTYADLELSSPRESDAGSAASVEAAYAASAAHASAEAALSAAPADDVEVEEALAYLQRRDVEAAGPSETGLAPADEGSDEEGLGGTSL